MTDVLISLFLWNFILSPWNEQFCEEKKEYGIPIFSSPHSTSDYEELYQRYLNQELLSQTSPSELKAILKNYWMHETSLLSEIRKERIFLKALSVEDELNASFLLDILDQLYCLCLRQECRLGMKTVNEAE